MKTTKKFESIASYQSTDFKDLFGEMEFEDKKSTLYSKKLEQPLLDKDILEKFKPTELTLGEIFNYLDTTANKGDWMIFYCKDISGVLRAVNVCWYDSGWGVRASSVEGPGEWGGGGQVFSRNPFDTQHSMTLSSSDTQTLDEAIRVCKEAGLTVTKIY
jgi:hypothetical protein